jgi:hypothetical protein
MLTEGWESHNSGCGDVSSSRALSVGGGAAMPGMVAQRQGRPHRAGGDGGDIAALA